MMSSDRSARRLAAAAGALVALALGAGLLCASPHGAWATQAAFGAAASASAATEVTTGVGRLTVTATEGVSPSLVACRIFDADVTDGADGAKVVANASWASDDAQRALEGAIASVDADYAGVTAQDAADWLAALPSDGAALQSVAGALAQALLAAGDAGGVPLTAGVPAEVPAGYWLIVSADAASAADGADLAGTAPILAVVGGADVTVGLKGAAPTVGKQVLEDGSDAWQTQADATVGDDLLWRLEATVPAGLSGYDAYALTFADSLSAGIAEPTDVRVYLAPGAGADGQDAGFWATSSDPSVADAQGWVQLDADEFATTYAPTADGADLTVVVSDLVASLARHGGAALADGARVCVVYDAPLNADAQRGTAEGNPNTVTLRYPRTPYSSGYGETSPQSAVAYTWDLVLTKRDATNDTPLSGAELRVTDDRGRHLTQDGTWVAQDATVVTAEDGTLSVSGVDAGTFTVQEVSAPQGYAAFSGSRDVTVSVGLDPDHAVHARVSVDLTAAAPLRADAFDASTGVATVSVLDTPGATTPPSGGTTGGTPGGTTPGGARGVIGSLLPKTGDTAPIALVAVLLVAGGVALAIARRVWRRGGER